MSLVAGVDGCRGGWVVAYVEDGATTFEIVADFAAVLCATETASIVAVDMPIGFPALVGRGGRGPDAAARRVLGKRKSSVFSMPARAAIYAVDYDEARTIARKSSDPPRSIAKQSFCIFPKIREIDALMTPVLQSRIVETHPEVAFWAMNGETPLDMPKRVRSRGHAPGLALRRALLEGAGLVLPPLPRGGGEDDFLDAAACAVVARRVRDGVARRFPDHPETDERGLRMEIWA